jgi:hypothetical protein
MNAIFVVGLLAVSTTLAWTLTTRRRERRRGLRAAGLALCEFAGLWTVLLALNLALGVTIVLAVRTATPFFISMYVLNDLSLAVASALQAFVVYWRRHPGPTEAA